MSRIPGSAMPHAKVHMPIGNSGGARLRSWTGWAGRQLSRARDVVMADPKIAAAVVGAIALAAVPLLRSSLPRLRVPTVA
ncbi:MAG: hypothetical protein JF593_06150 [Novosphingobium sp.]|nr:hypothetical protein [Novosphingobium sp.]